MNMDVDVDMDRDMDFVSICFHAVSCPHPSPCPWTCLFSMFMSMCEFCHNCFKQLSMSLFLVVDGDLLVLKGIVS
jgi:hypothetical protein